MIKIEEKTYLDWTATVVVNWVKFYLQFFMTYWYMGPSYVALSFQSKPYISHDIGIESH